MFNIVKRRDFMLGRNVSTKEEAEQAARNYGKDYIAVSYSEPPPIVLPEPELETLVEYPAP